jgi:hypothetical protein
MLEPCFSSGQRVALDDLRSHSHRLKIIGSHRPARGEVLAPDLEGVSR